MGQLADDVADEFRSGDYRRGSSDRQQDIVDRIAALEARVAELEAEADLLEAVADAARRRRDCSGWRDDEEAEHASRVALEALDAWRKKADGRTAAVVEALEVQHTASGRNAIRVLDGITHQSADHREAARLLQTQLAREYLALRRYHAR